MTTRDSLKQRTGRWLAQHPIASTFLASFLLSVVLGWELLVPGRSLYRWDALLYNWPILLETRAQLLSCHLPAWATTFRCGTPLLGNVNAAIFYPPRLLCWLLPLKAGYQLLIFFHLWMSVLGMHLLLRRGMKLSLLASFAGVLAFAASGYARAMWDTHNFMPLPWIPLGLAALLEIQHRKHWLGPALGATVCWSLLLLGGDFQAACLWFPVAILLALIHPRRADMLKAMGLVLVLGVMITAPQWITGWFASKESYRAAGLSYSHAVERSLNPIRLLDLLVPHAFGTHGNWFGQALAGEGATRGNPWAASIHIGRFALLAAILSLRKWRKPYVLWAGIVACGALLLSFGKFLPGFHWWLSLPVVGGFRYPEKYNLWMTLGLSVLAAHGMMTLAGLSRRETFRRVRWQLVSLWALAILCASAVVSVGLVQLQGNYEIVTSWIIGRSAASLLIIGTAMALYPHKRSRRLICFLPLLLLLDSVVPWHLEQPTTARLDALSMPAIARQIRNAGHTDGRLLVDPAAKNFPLPHDRERFTRAERSAIRQRAGLFHNSPTLWGLKTAHGFSPLESKEMLQLMLRDVETEGDLIPEVQSMASFCRDAGVSWIITSEERARAFEENGLKTQNSKTWGTTNTIVLLRVLNMTEARCTSANSNSTATAATVRNIWRRAPGRIRVDLSPGDACQLHVAETHSRGWRAIDEQHNDLPVVRSEDAFIGITVPAGTYQVRLEYIPEGWRIGRWIGLIGCGLLVVLGFQLLSPAQAQRVKRHPALAAAVACVLFVVLGVGARSQWACTFDEGFHVARGVARVASHDSRLSYYHPPLQNILCAYFGLLAHGEKIDLSDGKGWENGDVRVYATNLAALNSRFFPDLVQASRWGSTLLSLLLICLAAAWAARAAGVQAAWLAGLGIALNPNILAHGNLTTTDIGVLCFAVAGTYALWLHVHTEHRGALLCAASAYALAAATKYTGLIWLLAFCLFCLPLLAIARKSRRELLYIPIALGILAVVLVILYGTTPQVMNFETESFFHGKRLIAGRYIEGLTSQGKQALGGQRGFLAGKRFTQGHWWYMPFALIFKTPPVWLLGSVLASIAFLTQKRPVKYWIVWIPLLVFAVLLVFVNKLALGVRHALPLQVFGMLLAAVWCTRIRKPHMRTAGIVLLLAGSLLTAGTTYPHYISYFPAWSGGVDKGHRWLVDSNYDWGQDLEVLEQHWAALTKANEGQPLDLVYFGFVSPSSIYKMRTGRSSLCGFMHRTRKQAGGSAIYQEWQNRLQTIQVPAAASISALELAPYGIDFSYLRNGQELGRAGRAYYIYQPPLDSSPRNQPQAK